jgi:hypothetical protein
MAKKKTARSKAGKGQSRGVVFDFENFEVEMDFEGGPALDSGPSTPGGRREEAHKTRKSSNDPPIMNNPG